MTTPYFIECDTPEQRYRGETIINRTVNLSLVASFEKKKYNWYPDNDGLPGIRFYSFDNNKIAHWAYKDEKHRDFQYQCIIDVKEKS